MKKLLSALLIGFLTSLPGALTTLSSAYAYTFHGTETRLSTDTADQFDPSISGGICVYSDRRNADADVYYYDIDAGVEHHIFFEGDQMLSDVSGNRIVYTDYGLENAKIYVFDIETGVATRLTDVSGNQRRPAISGSLVVYEDDRNNNYDIYLFDLDTMTETRLTDDPSHQRKPSISGSIVVWEDFRNGNADIYMLDLDKGVTTPVTIDPSQDVDPDVDGDIIVFGSNRASIGDIYYYRISTGETIAATAGDNYERNPAVSGDYISYESYAAGDSDIWLHSIPLGMSERATTDSAEQYLHDISGNRVVYTDNRSGNLDIYLFEFTFAAEPGELLWQAPIGVVGYSSPAIGADGTVYVGSAVGVFALDRSGLLKNGLMNWPLVIGGVDSSPAIGPNGTIYVGGWDYTLYALDVSGDPAWTFTTGGSIISSSPAIGLDGTIYIGSMDENLYAVDSDGALKWWFPTGSPIFSSPAVGPEGTVYVGSGKDFYAINPDGTQRWHLPLSGSPVDVFSSPAIGSDGTIYLGVEHILLAITPDLSLKWYSRVGDLGGGGDILSSPAIGPDGMIYVGAGNSLFAIYEDDGTVAWGFETGNRVDSSPAVGSDGTVYVGSWDGKLYALNPDGSLAWDFTAAGPVYSSPVIDEGGIVYVGAYGETLEGYLYAVYSTSRGLASSSWPMFHRDRRHTGRSEGQVLPPVGDNIIVRPLDSRTLTTPVTLTFSMITQPGITSLITSEQGYPPPSTCKQLDPPTYYELETTAGYSGTIEVCIDYGTALFGSEERLRLFHLEEGDWIDATNYIDAEKDVICGTVETLSPFTVFEQDVLEVEIDIKPGSEPNCFNQNEHGVIPVAVLGNAHVNVLDISLETLLLQGLAVKVVGKKGKYLAHTENINGDAYLDLIIQFEDSDGWIDLGDAQAKLTGQLLDGALIEGRDNLCIVP